MKRVVFLARHGETEWNVQGRMQGHTDIGLNDVGREQARDLAEQLAKANLAAVASSDLRRAAETAQIVAEALGLELALRDPGLRERRFGVFEGLTRDECAAKHREHWEAWRRDPRATPPGAETHEELLSRA